MSYNELEIWAVIANTEGMYEVSNLGRIRSTVRKTRAKCGGTKHAPSVVRAPHCDKNGYHIINLSVNGFQRTVRVHQEVAKAFLPAPLCKSNQLNHRNGNKADNRIANLEWVTPAENVLHSWRHLHRVALKGEKSNLAKLTQAQAVVIRQRYTPGHPVDGGAALAREYGVSKQTVSNIIRGVRYAQ